MRIKLAMAIALCILVSSALYSQTTNATLGGTVADATGALIPGVEVTSRNAATGIVNMTITNETGTYVFASLQTGTYEVSAALPGFQTATFNNVALGGAQQVRLNFTLKVGDVATTVDVTADASGALVTTSSSIGTVLPEMQVRELPTGDRNVLELLRSVGGAGPTDGLVDGYFAGGRASQVVVSRDGFNVSAGRYNQGTFSTTYVSSDLVEEVRVTTGTVDAEASRGAGQVHMVTRSGTNDFRGSVFWYNRNSALDSTNWFDNFNGRSKTWENRNQFGGRIGGPIVKNKTFFFVLVDEQRWTQKQDFIGNVLTNEARNGIYRFFPGADNANVLQARPSVDRLGNPVSPGGATGPLQSINLFSYDPNRPGFDPAGYMQSIIARMPPPNDFTVGDGLNTAGIRWTRRISGEDVTDGNTYDQNNRDQINLRLDHNFNAANKLSFVYTYERGLNHTLGDLAEWPNGYDGANQKHPRLYNGSLVSTFGGNVVNELRVGYRAHKIQRWAPFYVGREGYTGEVTDKSAIEAFSQLPKYGGLPVQVVPLFYANGFNVWDAGFGGTRGSNSPLQTYGDTLSWVMGRHAFKAGGEFRRDRTDGWNDNNFTPKVTIGAGGVTAPITTTSVAGLTNNNSVIARNVLYNLAGSIELVRQGFDLVDSAAPLQLKGYQDGITLKRRDWRANEFSAFFKDDWKVTSNLSLNLGIHYEYFGVPYDGLGRAGRVVNGYQGLCGIGCGALTTVELVGKNSPSPEKQIFNDDWNNFAPSIGFSYSIPGLGRSTVLRAGYGVSYTGAQIKGAMGAGGLDAGAGTLPGLSGIAGGVGLTYTQAAYWSLANLVQLPFAPQFQPLAAVPLTDPRQLIMNMYEPNRVSPYVQNFNLSIQREITSNLLLDVSYVGSKGTKLYGRDDLNYVKIQGGFLDAFNVTRAGGTAPLFDQMLRGMNIPGAGVVNGTTVTGSQALRLYTNTRTLLANGSAGGLANFLNSTTNITGQGGGFIRNSGLFPENYIIMNPQFAQAGLNGNLANSTYHALQVQATKRLSHGITNRTGYTWSRTIGLSDDDFNVSARDPLNRNLDKGVLGFHRTHNFTNSGTLEMPFGPNRALLGSASGWVSRIVERWQLGGVLSWSSGAPLTLSAGALTNIYQQATNTPMILGELPMGTVTRMADGSLPNYFSTLTLGAAGSDPGRAAVTATNALSAQYTNRAIFDASGNAILVNPGPAQIGSMGIRTIEGPGRLDLDMNLLKKVQIDDKRDFELRVDITNVLNHPVFGNPNVDINSASFGRISTAGRGRRFTIGARVNF